jgi:hypothetical protein
VSACTECGWSEPGYSCDGHSKSPGCKLKLMDLTDKLLDAMEPDHTTDAAYDAVQVAIEGHFGVVF